MYSHANTNIWNDEPKFCPSQPIPWEPQPPTCFSRTTQWRSSSKSQRPFQSPFAPAEVYIFRLGAKYSTIQNCGEQGYCGSGQEWQLQARDSDIAAGSGWRRWKGAGWTCAEGWRIDFFRSHWVWQREYVFLFFFFLLTRWYFPLWSQYSLLILDSRVRGSSCGDDGSASDQTIEWWTWW